MATTLWLPIYGEHHNAIVFSTPTHGNYNKTVDFFYSTIEVTQVNVGEKRDLLFTLLFCTFIFVIFSISVPVSRY